MGLESTVHLRHEIDADGNTVDRLVYCSRTCYLNDYDARPLANQGVAGYEEGGAWPCYESEHSEYCAACGGLINEYMSEIGWEVSA